MSLVEPFTKDEEIDRLHQVIDARLFGTRVGAVRELQYKVKVFAECFDILDTLPLDAEARIVIEVCKDRLGVKNGNGH
jgi:hypothetical protein